MPQFLGRPNLPNSLANSLVQLAAAETDPLAIALGQVGKMADTYTATQLKNEEMKKQADLQESGKQKDFERQKQLKQMDMDASIYEKLLSNDRIISGMTRGMTSADADALIPGGSPRSKTKKAVESDFGKRENQDGVPLSSLGINISGDPRMVPSGDRVKIDAEMVQKYKLPANLVGKSLTMDQVLKLRGQDAVSAKGGAGRDPKRLELAQKIVSQMPELIDADLETKMAAIDRTYDSLADIAGGKEVKEPPKKEEPPKEEGFSLFGMFKKKPASAKPSDKAKKKLPGLE